MFFSLESNSGMDRASQVPQQEKANALSLANDMKDLSEIVKSLAGSVSDILVKYKVT